MTRRGLGTKGWNKLRFFKFVFDEDYSKYMYLPPMIAQKIPLLAGREIEIEDTTGSRWPVTVSEVNGSLAFQRGWQKFFSDHRLKIGELLVFKYIKGSHFFVRIFGLTACDRENFNNEMPGPIKRANRNPEPAVEEESFQTNNINNFDNEMPRPIKRDKRNLRPAIEEEPFQTNDTNSFDNEMPRSFKRDKRNLVPAIEEEPFQTNDINNFDYEMPRPIKSDKRNLGPAVEEEPFQINDINSFNNEMPRPIKRAKKNPGPAAEEEPFDMDMEAMMKKVDWCYQGEEDRTIWDDLSIFEPTNNAIIVLPSPNKSEKVPQSVIGFSEQAKSIGDDVQMVEGLSDERLTDKLEKPLNTNIAPFHSVIMDKTRESGHDAGIDVIQTNQIEGHSDDISTEKFKKAVDTKIVPFHHEITEQAIEKVCDNQTTAIHSSQTDIKHLAEPSESSSLGKGIFDVSSVQNESYSGSPLMGSSKNVCEGKSLSSEFPVFSSVGKDPSGKSALKSKTETIQKEEEAKRFPQACSGKSATKKETIQTKDEARHTRQASRGKSANKTEIQIEDEEVRHFPQASSGKSATKTETIQTKAEARDSRQASRGKRAIKKEIIEYDGSYPPQASSGKKLTMVNNHVPVIVKGEPLFFDDPSADFAPFEAEVKNKLYLELTEKVTTFHNKEKGKTGKVVYLRDPKERIWPLFYPNKPGLMALCLNWANFCHDNKIEPGDKCRFQFEKAVPCTIRVEVIPTSAIVPHR